MRHHEAIKTLILALLAAIAPSAGAVELGGLPRIEPAREPEAEILSFSLIHDMLAQQDPVPLLRIYGDGRVRVHRPDYMIDRGDYQLQLGGGELEALLLDLAATGVLELDVPAARLARREEVERRAQEGRYFSVSDATTTVLEIRLERYRPAGAALPITGFEQTIEWRNVVVEARQYPQVAVLDKLAAAQERLWRLFQRDDLVKLTAEEE